MLQKVFKSARKGKGYSDNDPTLSGNSGWCNTNRLNRTTMSDGKLTSVHPSFSAIKPGNDNRVRATSKDLSQTNSSFKYIPNTLAKTWGKAWGMHVFAKIDGCNPVWECPSY